MRTLSDCIVDMLRRRTEDREIEYLLSRQARDDTDGLVSELATLNLARLEISVDDGAADFAAAASRLVRPTDPAPTISPVRSPVVPRLATAALTAVLIVGLAGVAEAADAAAPGDTLYGLDRALERVGVNDGGLDERLDEAQALADDGQTAEALAHLAETLDTASPNAADALDDAANRFGVHDNPSRAVIEDVAALLDWMAVTELSGRDFGQGVAQRSREIGAGHADGAPAAKPETPANDTNSGDLDRPVDDDGDPNANTDDGSSNSGKGSGGSSGGGGNSDGSNAGAGGGKGSGTGPPGGSPPGQRAP